MLTLADVVGEKAGSFVPGARGITIQNVCVDSRVASPQSLFVALRGEHADGHDFVPRAFEAGATVALVERPFPGIATIDTIRGTFVPAPNEGSALSLPVNVVVADPLSALQRIARARRRAHPDLRVVAITGSVGKTTTKEAIAAVLRQRFTTIKSAGNHNNEIGLPLTLIGLDRGHQRAVLEMGAYALGEIASLCDIARPHVGVVTNILPVHLERFGSIHRIAQAKSELIQALPQEGIAILNGDDHLVREMAEKTECQVVTYGLGHDNTIWADQIATRGLSGVGFVAHVSSTGGLETADLAQPLEVSLLGRHAVLTSLAATAVGLSEGLTWDEIQTGLSLLAQGLRLVTKRGISGVTILDDTYNSSPASALAALDLLAELPGRHVAVLGDMLELGAREEQGHRDVGRQCAQIVDLLVTVGSRAMVTADAACSAGLPASVVFAVDDNRQALEVLSERLREGDTLLVKGSRGMAMEAIVDALAEGE